MVKVLNQVDRATEKGILEQLDETTPELSDELRKAMFVFEDIVTLDDRSIQRVLKDVDSKDLMLALRSSTEDVTDVVFRNMSQRASELLRDDLRSRRTGPSAKCRRGPAADREHHPQA